MNKKKTNIAVFGGGCFWCTEAIFQKLKGVISVIPGYAGGNVKNPTYDLVSQGTTGHAEVIKIDFDPDVISYTQLLDIFWAVHNPTSLNQQGNDIGSQYRSIILAADEEQLKQARDAKQELETSGKFRQSIVTEIQALELFYPAESYHHHYYDNDPAQPYCSIVITPKLQQFEEQFQDLLKRE
ncbi:MAG TPA: peptide-methionine (S)-S-oxide reductase MsrA [Patescibacteria group bacterium]|nr:peptide-methionine (S)-S-oxide reductase MsrA [Patescibacteria group bacterium]